MLPRDIKKESTPVENYCFYLFLGYTSVSGVAKPKVPTFKL